MLNNFRYKPEKPYFDYMDVNPCDFSCKKCGSKDVRHFYAPLNSIWKEFASAAGGVQHRSNEWVKTEKGLYSSNEITVKAIKECITHCCEICGYRFESDTKDEETKIRLQDSWNFFKIKGGFEE